MDLLAQSGRREVFTSAPHTTGHMGLIRFAPFGRTAVVFCASLRMWHGGSNTAPARRTVLANFNSFRRMSRSAGGDNAGVTFYGRS